MTVSLAWPSILPKPLLAMHGFEPMPPVIRSEEPDRGAEQVRRRFASVPTDVPFSLAMTSEEAAIFEAFVEYKAKHGAAWFTIDLLSGIGLSSCEARIKSLGELKQLEAAQPYRWQASGVFEVRERPILTDSLLDLVLEEDPYELIAAFGDFHQFVHFELGQ